MMEVRDDGGKKGTRKERADLQESLEREDGGIAEEKVKEKTTGKIKQTCGKRERLRWEVREKEKYEKAGYKKNMKQ